MTDEKLHKDGLWLTRLMLPYLAVQAATLLYTFLDFPAYMLSYRAVENMLVTGWAGVWLLLAVFGLSTGIFLATLNKWRAVFEERQRIKLSAGYELGFLVGLVTLGIRYMPVISPVYFYAVGGMALVFALAALLWMRLQTRKEELFP